MNVQTGEYSHRPVALVTGTAVRIGRAIAQALAEAGYDLALHYSRSGQEAEDLATQLRNTDCSCELFRADLADTKQMCELLPAVLDCFSRLNLLVNNASIFENASLRKTELDLFDRHMTVNIKAPLFLSRDFANLVGKGHIINILDQRVRKVDKDYMAYTLSKKALANFTLMAAKELAPGIRVNGIAPGYILPPADTEPSDQRVVGKIPLQCQGELDNVVHAVKYLIKNPFVTGEILYVDGGESL